MFSFKYPMTWEQSPYEGYYFVHTYPLPDKKTELTPVGEINSCREYYIRGWRNKIINSAASDPRTKKAFALITLGRPFENVANSWQAKLDRFNERSLHILNSFERKYKWPLTRVYPVNLAGQRKIPFAFFIGARKWTMSPYLMSIWTLGIRMGRSDWLPKKLLSLNNEQLVKQLPNVKAKGSMGDFNQVRNTITHWGPFMLHYHELFGGKARKDNWSRKHLHGKDDRPEGIVKLVNGYTGHRALHKKYFELREAEKHK